MPPISTPTEAANRNAVSMPFAISIETPNAASTAEGKKVCNPTCAIDSRVK